MSASTIQINNEREVLTNKNSTPDDLHEPEMDNIEQLLTAKERFENEDRFNKRSFKKLNWLNFLIALIKVSNISTSGVFTLVLPLYLQAHYKIS